MPDSEPYREPSSRKQGVWRTKLGYAQGRSPCGLTLTWPSRGAILRFAQDFGSGLPLRSRPLDASTLLEFRKVCDNVENVESRRSVDE
jgi:hypothetical protein